MKKFVENGLLLFAISCMLSGCCSMRFSTTLKPQPDPGTIFGEARFCVNIINLRENEPSEAYYGTLPCSPTTAPYPVTTGPNPYSSAREDRQAFIAAVVENYPSVFADDIRAIPVELSIHRSNSCGFDCVLYPVFIPSVLGILPCPESRKSRYETSLSTPLGNSSKSVSFSRRDAGWGTIFTPLGLLPVIGISDAPRRSGIDGDTLRKSIRKTGERLTYDSLGESVFQQLRSIPKEETERLYRERCTWLQTAEVNGRTLWLWSLVNSDDNRRHVWVFTARPTYSNWNPLDDLVFPSNPDGTYPPTLMRKPPYFTEVSVRNENGSVVVGARSVAPSIRQLLALADPDDGGAASLGDDALVAAMTRALIAAKNTEVPQLAVQAPVAERVAVLNAVEQRLMEAQKYVVGLNSQAEDAVRQGQDAAGFRRKSTDVQAYMSVLSEIKNLLMQS